MPTAVSQSRPRRTCLPTTARLVLGAGLWIASATAGFGHELFTAYIQHRVALVVGARHVDVTVQLTFFEDGSEHEREHVDANRDGRVSRAEMERYLKEAEGRLARAVKLRIGGKPLDLAALFAPQLDLLDNDRVGRGHHQLTLHFFAPTPGNLTAGVEVVVEDRLWPDMRALGAVQVEGRDGCRLEALPPDDPVYLPAREGEAREFKARILAPPTSSAARSNSPQLFKP